MKTYLNYIDGQWLSAANGATAATVNPATGEPWAIVPESGEVDIDNAVRAARRAFEEWRVTTPSARARLLRELANLIRENADDLAAIETQDNGKLLREMRGQLTVIPDWVDYFAGLTDKLEGRTIPTDKANFFIYTRREPVGVVAAIVPWNSPLLLLSWKLAPALAVGCTVVAKPSPHTPTSALALADLIDTAGFPPGVVNVVTTTAVGPSAALVAHPQVDKIAFTGSTRVGREVGKSAVDHLARISLELGGKSAQVVFADADLEATVNGIVAGIFAATGQTCLAGSRLIVHRDLAADLTSRLTARARTINLGDPAAPETQMGSLANEDQLAVFLQAIEVAVSDGATVACGGNPRPELGPLFVEPTVITNVRPEMAVARDEIFGPVLAVMPFTEEDEAIALANNSDYGLAAGIWTADIRRAHRVAHELRAGTVWINAYRTLAPQVPFGGMGRSGIGREGGIETALGYTETKAIWIELEGQTRDPFILG